MSLLKIGLAQCQQTADFNANINTIFRFLDKAAREEVQIICFPETQTVGYRVDIVKLGTPVPAQRLREVHQLIAKRCGELGMACILGTELPVEGNEENCRPFNSALVINEKGKILGAHHKTKLTPLDAVVYTPGNSLETFTVFDVTIGVVICFEGFRFPETTAECVRQGAQIVFHPQNNTTRPNDWKIPVHHAMITTRAAENTIWFASCNCVHIPHQNCRSMIIAPDGQVAAQSELKQEELVTAYVDLDRATRAMFLFDQEGCAEMLFGDTVRTGEYKQAGSVDHLPR